MSKLVPLNMRQAHTLKEKNMAETQLSLSSDTIAAIAQAWLIHTEADAASEAWKNYMDAVDKASATDVSTLKADLVAATSELDTRMRDFFKQLQIASIVGAAGPLLGK